MRLLIDTNVLIDLAREPERLREDVVERLAAETTSLVVSVISAWEVSIKWRLGKLTLPVPPAEWMTTRARRIGADVLPVALAHAVRVADLPDHHRDPFDRLLIAQAQVEGLAIVTADRSFGAYDVEVVAARET